MITHLRGVVFDLDGTLAETHPMAIQLIGESIARFGGPELTPDQVVSLFGRNEKGILREAIGSGWEIAWDFYLRSYVDRHAVCPEPFADIPQLLQMLVERGCRLGLVTGKTALTGGLSLEVLGLSDFFTDLRGGSMDGVTKSDDIGAMVRTWGLETHSVAYVGDTATDVKQARSAGVGAIGACWSGFADEAALSAAGPDELFSSVQEMSDWVEARVTG